jgi:hypothetical protein
VQPLLNVAASCQCLALRERGKGHLGRHDSPLRAVDPP